MLPSKLGSKLFYSTVSVNKPGPHHFGSAPIDLLRWYSLVQTLWTISMLLPSMNLCLSTSTHAHDWLNEIPSPASPPRSWVPLMPPVYLPADYFGDRDRHNATYAAHRPADVLLPNWTTSQCLKDPGPCPGKLARSMCIPLSRGSTINIGRALWRGNAGLPLSLN